MAMTAALAIFLAIVATVVASVIFGKEDNEEGKRLDLKAAGSYAYDFSHGMLLEYVWQRLIESEFGTRKKYSEEEIEEFVRDYMEVE